MWQKILAKVFLIGDHQILHMSTTPISVPPFTIFPSEPTTELPLRKIVTQLPHLYKQLLGRVIFPQDDGFSLTTAIAERKCLGASDGSVTTTSGSSFAVKLCDRDRAHLYEDPNAFFAIGRVDGVPAYISSLRAESRGAIASLLLIFILSQKWPDLVASTSCLSIFCDNKEFVRHVPQGVPWLRL